MLWPLLLAISSAASAPLAQPARAESQLAAAALREAERRGRVKARRSYNDEDLRPTGALSQTGDQSEAPAATSYAPAEGRQLGDGGGEGHPPGPADPDMRDEQMDAEEGADPAFTGWRERLRAARNQVAEARGPLDANHRERDAARSKLNPMSTNYVSDTNQQLQAQAALTNLQAEERDLQRAVDEAEAALRELEQNARRSRVPPRWLEPSQR